MIEIVDGNIDKLLEIRKRILKEVIANQLQDKDNPGKYSVYDLAEYFCTKPNVIKKLLKEINISLPPSNYTYRLEAAKDMAGVIKDRNTSIQAEIEKVTGSYIAHPSSAEIIEKYGLYQFNLTDYSQDKELLKILNSGKIKDKEKIKKTVKLCSMGFPPSDACQAAFISTNDKRIIEPLLNRIKVETENNITRYASKIIAKKAEYKDKKGSDVKSQGEVIKSLAKLTGVSYYIIFDAVNGTRYASRNSMSYERSKKVSSDRYRSDKEKQMVDAYSLWISGEKTQFEIAIEKNVSRQTIISWIKNQSIKEDGYFITGAAIPRRRNTSKKSDTKSLSPMEEN